MKLTDLAKKMIRSILILSGVFILAAGLYYRSMAFLPFMLGVIMGAAVSIYKVFLLERAVDRALEMGGKRAGNYVSLQHMLRLLLTGVALVVGALVPQVSLWGVAAGVITFQLALYTVRSTAK